LGSGQRDKVVNSLCPGGGGRGRGGPLKGVGPENHMKLTACSTEYRIQNTAATKNNVHKITKVPGFFWRSDFMILIGANPLLGP
jgi:hypothetical protein